jgi:hypothetical protein
LKTLPVPQNLQFDYFSHLVISSEGIILAQSSVITRELIGTEDIQIQLTSCRLMGSEGGDQVSSGCGKIAPRHITSPSV